MTIVNKGPYQYEFTTPKTMAKQGWTPALIQTLLGGPDDTTRNTFNWNGPPANLYRVSRVLDAENSPEFKSGLTGKRQRKANSELVERRVSKFKALYGGWKVALADGCGALLRLDRYAMHESCSGQNQKDIFRLSAVAILTARI